MLMILKTRWLLNIHFFIDETIEKSTLHIHLKEFESTYKAKASNNLTTSNLATGAKVSP